MRLTKATINQQLTMIEKTGVQLMNYVAYILQPFSTIKILTLQK